MSRFRTLPWFATILVVTLCATSAFGSRLSPEEEHRLVIKADATVIDEKLKDMPFGVLMAPAPMDEHSLPMPTMDPPLPETPKHSVKITTVSGGVNKGALSDRIRNAMKTMKERMKTLQSSRPRPPKKSAEPPKFPRPSSLITSNPSDLEVAMKRIEIMASRAGFNMSSMPRRTQLQIVSKLAAKLPPKMGGAVNEEMENMSGKLYQYLPEPARDPLIEDDQAFLQHFMDQFDNPHPDADEFYKEVNSHNTQNQQKVTSFDVSQVSLTDDFSNEPYTLSESLSSASSASGATVVASNSPNTHLMPPKFDAGEGDHAVHTYTHIVDDDVPKPSALVSQYPTHHVEEHDPLVTLSSEVHGKSVNVSRGTKSFQVGSVKSYGVTPSTSKAPPIRQPPTKAPTTTTTTISYSEEEIVSVPPKPIRVSVITKDSILVNDTAEDGTGGPVRTIKYVHVEPLPSAKPKPSSEMSLFDKFLLSESNTKEVKINPKEISVQIDKHSVPTPKHSFLDTFVQETPKEAEVPEPTPPSEEPVTEDPYPLTDEEIAATVAELKKYEAELAGLRQAENSLEVDYPYRLTPHPLEYPDHPDHPQPTSLEDEDLVSHLDELLAEIGKPKESKAASLSTVQTTSVPSTNSPPFVLAPGHRRPHPLLKHRPPLRPGLGRPLMMGSRLRPLIQRPPVGFPRPLGANSPPKINEVTVSQLPQKFNKECDYFSDELCLLVQDYPIEAITEAMEQNPSVSTALLSKEPAHNQKSTSYIDGIPESPIESSEGELGKHPDFTGEGGFLCPSKVAYGKIKKAKSSTSGDWKFIVNYGDKTQTLRLEKCLSPGDSCSYIMPHFRTACTQVYNYHRLLAWDSEKGLHTDVFKVPTCCTCHVLGYYVPGSKKGLPQTPAIPSMRRRDHLGPRFMGPPRARRIPHLPPPRKPIHPMMVLMAGPSAPSISPLNVAPPTAQVLSATSAPTPTNSSSSAGSDDESLRSLLMQYSSLREKIAKLKDSKGVTSLSSSAVSSSSLQSKRSSKLYSHWPKDIIKALRKRKRQSTISQKNNKMKKPSPEMLKKLKNLLANSTKLENNPKLKAKIQKYLKKIKDAREGKSLSSSSRRGRNMKLKLTPSADAKPQKTTKKTGLSKADAKKRLTILLSAATKKLQEERKASAATTSSTFNRLTSSQASMSAPRNRQLGPPPPSKVNYESHPIWNYFHKLQAGHAHPPASRARRLRRLF